MTQTLPKKYLLGVGFTDAKKKIILEYIINHCKKGQKKWYMVTPNPEILVMAENYISYKNALNGAELASVDGMGIVMASKLLGKGFSERFSGVDVVQELCKEVVRKPITVGFLGGRGQVAEMTAECLKKQYPGLRVSFIAEEWSKDLSASCDILFVALGSPNQELFIADYLAELPCTVAIGVGGAFDMISGKVSRAPKVVRSIGLEWLYRLIRQPWRWKRQLRLLVFIWLVLKEKMLG